MVLANVAGWFYLLMSKLAAAIERTIKFLGDSEDSIFSELTAAEIIEILEKELIKIKTGQDFDETEVKLLFLPTSNIQEIAILNEWSAEYLKTAEIVDKHTLS